MIHIPSSVKCLITQEHYYWYVRSATGSADLNHMSLFCSAQSHKCDQVMSQKWKIDELTKQIGELNEQYAITKQTSQLRCLEDSGKANRA